MRELGFQLEFSGQSFRHEHSPARLREVLDDPAADRMSDAELGWALHRQSTGRRRSTTACTGTAVPLWPSPTAG